MDEKEPEVVHLKWERVQDPTREPPPEMVVAEPEPQPSNPVRDFLNQPNPVGQPGNEAVTFIAYAIIITIGAVVIILVRGG
jgi:hypothetical protein